MRHACSVSTRQRCRGYSSGPKIESLTVLSGPLLPVRQSRIGNKNHGAARAIGQKMVSIQSYVADLIRQSTGKAHGKIGSSIR
jgi:hypothetical protein